MTFREDLKLAKDKEEKRLIVPAHLQSQEMFTEQLYRGEKTGAQGSISACAECISIPRSFCLQSTRSLDSTFTYEN